MYIHIQLPCGLTPPPCQGITHLGHGRQWYHCVLLCLHWRFGCDIVDLSRRSAKSWQVRLTSAVLLRLCGRIWVVCVPHWIVVLFVLVQTSATTGRFHTQVFVHVMLLRAAVCGMAYTRECVKPGHACFALYFLSWKSLREKVTTRNLCDRAISYASSVDLSRHNVMHRRSI